MFGKRWVVVHMQSVVVAVGGMMGIDTVWWAVGFGAEMACIHTGCRTVSATVSIHLAVVQRRCIW
jgi:hypothetical protein